MKLAVAETGSDDARALFADASLVASSRLLEPETRSAIARAWKGGRLVDEAARRARVLVEGLLRQVEMIELDGPLARRAGDRAEEHGLRGYEAVHLASFERLLPDALLVTSDRELARAARTLGYAVAVPDD